MTSLGHGNDCVESVTSNTTNDICLGIFSYISAENV